MGNAAGNGRVERIISNVFCIQGGIFIDKAKVRELIKNYKYYAVEVERLGAALELKSEKSKFVIEPASFKRDNQIRARFERINKELKELLNALNIADFTDYEWSVVDCIMDGMTYREIGRLFNCSHGNIQKMFDVALGKILEQINLD